ncbi:MAG: hypothetical protein HC820_04905 [Hydrococcus sp. RM1_1_31]|nr:hypothetical protein [Hydrococcus sp. RM1_1_31]
MFIIYFVFASLIQYNLKDKTSLEITQISVQNSEESPEIFTYKNAFSAKFDPDPAEAIAPEIVASVELESEEKVEASTTTEITDNEYINLPTTNHSNHQSIPEIIDRLSKRELRKLCSRKALNIQQKTNGIELTVDLMKASVKRKFKENPQKVTQVIGERLPHLLATLPKSNQQQQLEILAS